jgi:hypothetical protein
LFGGQQGVILEKFLVKAAPPKPTFQKDCRLLYELGYQATISRTARNILSDYLAVPQKLWEEDRNATLSA